MKIYVVYDWSIWDSEPWDHKYFTKESSARAEYQRRIEDENRENAIHLRVVIVDES